MQPCNYLGSFLIRNSQNTSSGYALSIRKLGMVTHFKISILNDGHFRISNEVAFNTLPELVRYYQTNKHNAFGNLKFPCRLETVNMLRETNEIDKKSICLIKKFGDSYFGELWAGQWNGTTEVNVKVCKSNAIATSEYVDEISFMKKLRHRNILQLYAACTKEEPIYIVTEVTKHGILLAYLRDDGGCILKLQELLNMGEQVASGMAYLEQNNYVHRDVAARNILVAENLICKVANFGLACVTNEGMFREHSKEKLATKWMAPEAEMHNCFTIKSDVWSFGIFLYELVTYGSVPYPEMNNTQVLEELKTGYCMPRPDKCPHKFYEFMRICWMHDSAFRPTFKILHCRLKEYLADVTKLTKDEHEGKELGL